MRSRFKAGGYNGHVKRLVRLLRTATILFSLLLFLSCILIWVRSYPVSDGLTHTHLFKSHGVTLRRVLSLDSIDGRLVIGVGHMTIPLFEKALKGPFAPYPPPTMIWSHLGFRHSRIMYGDMMEVWFFGIPFWFLTLVFATPPSVWLFNRVRRGQKSPHACPACGYDLRATSHRCPECGSLQTLSV